MRGDQLAQHIKIVHLTSKTDKTDDAPNSKTTQTTAPKDLIAAWKVDNPCLPKSYLQCGFCGDHLDTWAQRQTHVFDHIQRGADKTQ